MNLKEGRMKERMDTHRDTQRYTERVLNFGSFVMERKGFRLLLRYMTLRD